MLDILDAVIATARAHSSPGEPCVEHPTAAEFFRGDELLRLHSEAALGPTPRNRDVRIMVTLPTEAAADYALVLDLVVRGMDVARINCGLLHVVQARPKGERLKANKGLNFPDTNSTWRHLPPRTFATST